ncbi:MAG: winged helix-turn-helix transcriptional regulator [Candidatus Wallbacteria bacterium]|nr:winged helix-turn-helix transcriptional regulator [Candidatus Wallbacteria bacterium]
MQIRKRTRDRDRRSVAATTLAELLSPALFRALCDPGRLQILGRLACCGKSCTVGEIGEGCEVDLSVVSRHLAMLREAGVLSSSKRGRNVYYGLDVDRLAAKLRAMADALEACCPPGAARRVDERQRKS